MKDEEFAEVVYERGDPAKNGLYIQITANPKAVIWLKFFAVGILAGIAYLVYLAIT